MGRLFSIRLTILQMSTIITEIEMENRNDAKSNFEKIMMKALQSVLLFHVGLIFLAHVSVDINL